MVDVIRLYCGPPNCWTMEVAERTRVVILGGGMAGLAAAWRLSEPGWTDRHESITVYQRGHRLGGKGASSRSANDRIEEHGLHIWLGYYENAFRLLRACYDELDRPRTDPEAIIREWTDALKPSVDVGLQDIQDGAWHTWLGDFSPNDLIPGEPAPAARSMTVQEFVGRAYHLLVDYQLSLDGFGERFAPHFSTSPNPETDRTESLGRLALGTLVEMLRLMSAASGHAGLPILMPQVDEALSRIRDVVMGLATDNPRRRRTWHLISIVAATVRGIVADGLLLNPGGFNAINDEDYRSWILRHGCAQEAARSTLIRGLYDLVFAHADGDPNKPGFGAGLGVFLSAKTFFDYKGAIFWKMQAGMGDVVFCSPYIRYFASEG